MKKEFFDKELFDMVADECDELARRIELKTGKFVKTVYSILEDTVKNSFEIDVDVAFIENPHAVSESKVRWFIDKNPEDCLNYPILLTKNKTWYKIYDGVHRTEANKRLGKKKVKATIIKDYIDK